MNNIPIVLMSVALGFVLGASLTSVYFSSESDTKTSPRNDHSSHDTHGSSLSHDMHGEMDAMMANLEGKTGDAFDEAFLDDMIIHHEGAVVMSQAVLEHAKHEELKKLARDIISAQEKEIALMKQWRSAWYGR